MVSSSGSPPGLQEDGCDSLFGFIVLKAKERKTCLLDAGPDSISRCLHFPPLAEVLNF